MAASNGSRARCSSGLKPSAFSASMLRTLQPRNLSPYDFASPRAALTNPVRVRTRLARARIIIRSACACALRCFTGYNNSGSIRASRASVCASSRSSFLRLSPINRTLRALATITSCPNSPNKRLIHGECVPISSAIRLRGIPPKTSCNAFAVVRTRCSSWIWPVSSTTQYQLLRSPRSNPMVSFCCEIFPLCWLAAVLVFFIAGLLYRLCFEHVDNLGAYSIPSETGLLISSDFLSWRMNSYWAYNRRPHLQRNHRIVGQIHPPYSEGAIQKRIEFFRRHQVLFSASGRSHPKPCPHRPARRGQCKCLWEHLLRATLSVRLCRHSQ